MKMTILSSRSTTNKLWSLHTSHHGQALQNQQLFDKTQFNKMTEMTLRKFNILVDRRTLINKYCNLRLALSTYHTIKRYIFIFMTNIDYPFWIIGLYFCHYLIKVSPLYMVWCFCEIHTFFTSWNELNIWFDFIIRWGWWWLWYCT